MSKLAFPVSVNSTVFSPEAQVQTNPEWVQALSYAHRKELTRCLCTKTPVKLVVKHYGADRPNSHYGLALWPDTGVDHDSDCQYFEDESDTGSSDQSTLPAFHELDDGTLRVHLATPLQMASATPAAPRSASKDSTAGKSRARASEIALLLRLWRHADLNVHDSRRPSVGEATI